MGDAGGELCSEGFCSGNGGPCLELGVLPLAGTSGAINPNIVGADFEVDLQAEAKELQLDEAAGLGHGHDTGFLADADL